MLSQSETTARYRSVLLLCVALSCIAWVNDSDKVQVGETPSWVIPASYDSELVRPDEELGGGVHYLLVDTQTRVNGPDVEEYWRLAFRVVNSEGVRNQSQLSIEFDPEYQSLDFHQAFVVRDGEPRNQLSLSAIDVIQQEDQLHRQIYDGRRSALLFLSDVRPGDIIEYAYTRRGLNPAFQGKFVGGRSLQWAVPVETIRHRLLWPKDRKLRIRNHGTEIERNTRSNGTTQEFTWVANEVPALVLEAETPSWFSPYPWIQFSEFEDWDQVAAWGASLYRTPPSQTDLLDAWVKEIQETHPSLQDQITATVRHVQNDIRYLGIELGAGAYEPTPSPEVLERRFGDCKDKALLCVDLLSRLGVQAAPALVNTTLCGEISRWLPSPHAFDHVIVRIVHDDQPFWIDTTIPQRGRLGDSYVPSYGRALVLTSNGEPCQKVSTPECVTPSLQINRTFQVAPPGDTTWLTVESVFSREEADWIRAAGQQTSNKELEQSFLEFYLRAYPSAEIAAPLEWADDEENNQIRVVESYTIPDFWDMEEDDLLMCDASALEMEARLHHPVRGPRTMPCALPFPMHVSSVTTLHLPQDWSIDNESRVVETNQFRLAMNRVRAKNKITLFHEYQVKVDHVTAEGFAAYCDEVEKARSQLGYYLTYPKNVSANFAAAGSTPADEDFSSTYQSGLHVGASGVAAFVVVLSLFMAVQILRLRPRVRDEEIPDPRTRPRFGGIWLTLLGLNLIGATIIRSMEIYSCLPVFTVEGWHLMSQESVAGLPANLGQVILGVVCVEWFLLVLCSVSVILYFMRRRSFRSVCMAFLLINCGVSMGSMSLFEGILEEVDKRDAARTFWFSVIWVAYLYRSERVKELFVNGIERRRLSPAQEALMEKHGLPVRNPIES